MDPETQKRVEALQAEIAKLNERLVPGIPQDEWATLKAGVAANATEIESLLKTAREKQQAADLEDIKKHVEDLTRQASKASLLGGSPEDDELTDQAPGAWLKALYMAKKTGDPAAYATLKATLGETDANGGYIVPNNVVANVIEIAKAQNIYRRLLDVVPGVRGTGVDIPYEVDDSSLQRAIGQGGEALSYGSNKDTRNFTVASATATLFTIARIIDVGNQFLRQSEGAAERLVRSKLGRAFALAEAHYILNGTGANNQPKGLITSIAAASSSFTNAYSSGVRADTLATALGALETRSYFATAIVVNPADFWQIVTDTQGSSGSGGYAVSPMGGASFDPGEPNSALRIWGVPVLRDPNMTVGTALMGEWSSAQLFTGDQYRIDVSSEAGTRFDTNITGFRAEEEIAFNADPYVIVGMFQRVTGL